MIFPHTVDSNANITAASSVAPEKLKCKSTRMDGEENPVKCMDSLISYPSWYIKLNGWFLNTEKCRGVAKGGCGGVPHPPNI